jgi:hypothetical protein
MVFHSDSMSATQENSSGSKRRTLPGGEKIRRPLQPIESSFLTYTMFENGRCCTPTSSGSYVLTLECNEKDHHEDDERLLHLVGLGKLFADSSRY